MPADRTKSSRRDTDGGNQLTWTPPLQSSANSHSISFAPNVTPVTFHDPPLHATAPPESTLFPPPADDGVPPPLTKRQGHGQKKPENHIPRPPNAFILFRSSFIKNQHVSTEVETNHSTLSKIIGLTWQNLPHDERQIWHVKAKAALDEHKRRYPQYAFRPLHSKNKTHEKRKVREVGPKDIKRCEKIAELLVEGMKGPELDAAIKEFDATHVPEIVTRFEAPLTAKMYRRGSSAPPPDTEKSSRTKYAEGLTAYPSSPSLLPRKARASSSQPMNRFLTPPPFTTPSPALTEPESVEAYTPPPPLPSYVIPADQIPSFDLSSFSFEPDLPRSACATEVASFDFLTQCEQAAAVPPLYVDVSSSPRLFDPNWTLCSPSPLSSAVSPLSDCPPLVDPMTPNTAFAHFDSFPQPVYAAVDGHSLVSPLYGHPHLSKQTEMDLITFMAALPATAYPI